MASSLTGEPAAKLQDATTRIYEACSFQDITGQRITKVVATLKTIEAKVAQIVATFGGSDRGRAIAAAAETGEAALLNGPQHPAVAMDQSDIDQAAGQLRMRPPGIWASALALLPARRRRLCG